MWVGDVWVYDGNKLVIANYKNMKKKFTNLLFIFLVFSQGVFCQTKSYVLVQKYLFNYTHFTSQGNYTNGLKDGKWVDVSDSGVIYVDGYYSHGIPISEWKINYPNGVLRKATLYDSLGNIIRWTRYDLGTKKLLEIIPDSIITFSTMRLISGAEENYFDLESIDYSPDFDYRVTEAQARQELFGAGLYKFTTLNIVKIVDTLSHSDFQGKCLVYYESGNVSKQYNYKRGVITDVRQFYYKNGKVNIEDVYIDNKLKRSIKYDEAGNVIKIKEK